jgi:ankyrin repeat protein
VALLLKVGADPLAQDKDGTDPIHVACRNGRRENVALLLKAVAKVLQDRAMALASTPKGDKGAGAKKVSKAKVTAAAITPSAAAEGALAAYLTSKDKVGFSAMHYAVIGGNINIVTDLIAAGGSVDPQDKNKDSPLMLAAMLGLTAVAQALLANGASVNLANKRGYTVLHHAIKNGQFDVAQLAIRAGADVNAKDTSGHSVS